MDSRKPSFMYYRLASNSLHVRFQNVEHLQFNTVLGRFKAQFPKAHWRRDRRVWELSETDLQDVALFAYEVFGKGSLRFLDDDTPR